MYNEDVRNKATEKGVRLWQIADRLGIADTTFSKRLRKPLKDGEKSRIFRIIDELESAKSEEE